MIVEKAHIDREKQCREEETRRLLEQRVKQVAALLYHGECLGEPFREEARIVVPVVKAEASKAAPADAETMRALTAAWMDADLE